MAKSGKGKAPKYAREPQLSKTPKFVGDQNVKGAPLSWRFSHHDRDGPFAWPKVFELGHIQEVVERLSAVEGLAEHELTQDGSHSIELHQLCKEAQNRLTQLRHDDLDSVYSLRVSGPKRVFCIHYGNIMRVLWYDPDHEVCPSQKKHT